MYRSTAFKLLIMLMAIGMAVFSWQFRDDAFPELSPSFKLKQHEVAAAADKLAKQMGYKPEAYQASTSFSEKTTAKYFLELEYGLDELRAASDKGVKLWYWIQRYFQPESEKEFTIQLDTLGRPTGFIEVVPETEVRAELSQSEARQKAEEFLASHVQKHPLNTLKLIETGKTQRTGHTVHKFTWKRVDWSWGDGPYYIKVHIKGDRVGAYGEYLKVPEAWTRDFTNKRSENKIYQTIAETMSIILLIGGLILFIRMIIRHEVNFHNFPLIWLLPVSLIILTAQLSQFPDIIYNYETTDNFNSYLTDEIIAILYSSLLELGVFLVLAFIADAMWHKAFPHHVPIRALLNGRGINTESAMNSVLLGFFFALASLTYVTAFYIFGNDVGIWTPSSINYSEVITSYLPAAEALYTGVSASWLEELGYRVIALLVLFRLTGSKWFAIIVSAAVWGFMHSNYPQLPGYARGIELTLEGILLGWVALRYGILTTLLSHCLYNTWLGAFVAFQSGSPLHIVLAIIVSIWPAALLLKGYLYQRQHHTALSIEQLAIGSPTIKQQLFESERLITDKYLQPRSIHPIIAVGMVLLAVILYSFAPISKLDSLGNIEKHHDEIGMIADNLFEQETGSNSANFYKTIKRSASIASYNKDYLLQHISREKLEEIIEQRLFQDYWKVTYFKERERTFHILYLKPDGQLFLLKNSIADTDPGEKIHQKDALYIARGFMEEKFAIDSSTLDLISIQNIERKNRRDFKITFEDTAWKIGDSKLRWNLSIQGDRINSFSKYIKLPDDYRRELKKHEWKDTLNTVIEYISSGILLASAFLLIGLLLYRHMVPWKQTLLAACAFPALAVFTQINESLNFYSGYSTTQSFTNFYSIKAIDFASDIFLSYIVGVFLFAIAFGLVKWLTGKMPNDFLSTHKANMSGQYRQGVAQAFFLLGLIICIDYSAYYIERLFIPESSLSVLTVSINSFFPAISSVLTSLQTSLLEFALAIIYMLTAILFWHKHRSLLIALISVLILQDINSAIDSNSATLFTLGYFLLLTITKFAVFILFFRSNIIAYLLFFYYQALMPDTYLLFSKSWPAYSGDAILALIALLLPLIALIFYQRKQPEHVT